MHLKASAACGDAAGYPAGDVLAFISRMGQATKGHNGADRGRRIRLPMLTVAELKTSLQPEAAGKVGEFLAYALYIFHSQTQQQQQQQKQEQEQEQQAPTE